MDSIVKTGVFEYQGKEYSFEYFTDINIDKKVLFVKGVANVVVEDKHYLSVLRGLVFGYQLINIFSDALSNFKNENGEDKDFSNAEIEDIVMNTKIVDIIMANAKAGLIDELQEAVDKDIEYKTGIHRNPVGEAVAGLLGTLEQRVKNIDIDGLIGFAEVFKGISGDDMTPEKLWDAYSKSEAFKKLMESRKNTVELSEKDVKRITKLVEKDLVEAATKTPKRGRKPKAKKEETVVEDKKVKDE